jgi:hypothetical protein
MSSCCTAVQDCYTIVEGRDSVFDVYQCVLSSQLMNLRSSYAE